MHLFSTRLEWLLSTPMMDRVLRIALNKTSTFSSLSGKEFWREETQEEQIT